jgi:hypothetical protein
MVGHMMNLGSQEGCRRFGAALGVIVGVLLCWIADNDLERFAAAAWAWASLIHVCDLCGCGSSASLRLVWFCVVIIVCCGLVGGAISARFWGWGAFVGASLHVCGGSRLPLFSWVGVSLLVISLSCAGFPIGALALSWWSWALNGRCNGRVILTAPTMIGYTIAIALVFSMMRPLLGFQTGVNRFDRILVPMGLAVPAWRSKLWPSSRSRQHGMLCGSAALSGHTGAECSGSRRRASLDVSPSAGLSLSSEALCPPSRPAALLDQDTLQFCWNEGIGGVQIGLCHVATCIGAGSWA